MQVDTNKSNSDNYLDKIFGLIAQLEVDAKEQHGVSMQVFAKIFFALETGEDMMFHSPEEWVSIFQSHWEAFNKPLTQDFNLRVVNIPGACDKSTFVQVTSKDMPFLVDSLSMAIARNRYGARYLVHSAGFRVCRDEGGVVTSLVPYEEAEANQQSNGSPEAIILLEVSRQDNEEIHREMEETLTRVLADVCLTVTDWRPMRQEMRSIEKALRTSPPAAAAAEDVQEVADFLCWAATDHFIFLGCREYSVVGEGDSLALRLLPDYSFGVLRDSANSTVIKAYLDMPQRVREQALAKEQIVTLGKTNTRATVHRDGYTDYIAVKKFDAQGRVSGETQFIGLFTSVAYVQQLSEIPMMRKKVQAILEASNLPPNGHLWKSLVHIINNLPRDDLMYASVEKLCSWCMGIMQVQDRHRTRLFHYIDPHNRYVSCMVYLPRENLSTGVVHRIRKYFQEIFNSSEIEYETRLFGSTTARAHFQIRLNRDEVKAKFDFVAIEANVFSITASWFDLLTSELMVSHQDQVRDRLFARYRDAFPVGYREAFSAKDAVLDIQAMEALEAGSVLAIRAYTVGDNPRHMHIKMFSKDSSLPLSDVLPVLENMGVRVEAEFPYQFHASDGQVYWLNDFEVILDDDLPGGISDLELFKASFYQCWSGCVENDRLNKLVIKAGLSWSEIRVLRAYGKYFKQIQFGISESYIATILVNRSSLAKKLVKLFCMRFDPNFSGSRDSSVLTLVEQIMQEIDTIKFLDEDRVCRQYLRTIQATIRTNFYQLCEGGVVKPYLSLKIKSLDVPCMVSPIPEVEAFIFSSSFEGVHLRSSKVARGGIRWSTRLDDFRTEVLGLMKAQTVKNAVIVPSGAKGGFVIKTNTQGMSRDELHEEARRCYTLFVNGLLDVSDNMTSKGTSYQDRTVSYDEDDPYIVVAADKGTATFSDLANSVAESRDFWLGDAFASGGSYGYDHKKMGITARGAWVSAIRHFKELGVDLNVEPVSVVGIGDMSGDVFGNGMLLSPQLRLIAAFNHMHIFFDPNPDPAISFVERQRLFELPRSGWADYNVELISRGGGVFDRTSKSIKLSPEMQKWLDVDVSEVVPSELIKRILRMPVDLLWNGGIGTYVKSSSETHTEVGDRANDMLRVDGADLSCRVVCEGGNLGLTQLGRIEYERVKGGLICTDFIDNSAGVDCSDHEVNIKILLNQVVKDGDISMAERNELLPLMTDEVARLVLDNNAKQTNALSYLKYRSKHKLGYYSSYISKMVELKNMDLELDSLPTTEQIQQRMQSSQGLTLPEICTLYSNCKLALRKVVQEEDLIADPVFLEYLLKPFPTLLKEKYLGRIKEHPLGNDIICMAIINQFVSFMGILFMYTMRQEMEVSVINVIKAYVAVIKIFELEELFAKIDGLPASIKPIIRYEMRSAVTRLIRRSVRWMVRHYTQDISVEELIDLYKPAILSMRKQLSHLADNGKGAHKESFYNRWVEAGVDEGLVQTVLNTYPMYHWFNIAHGSVTYHVDLNRFAKAYYLVLTKLGLVSFREKIDSIIGDDSWSMKARSAYKQDFDAIQCKLTARVLAISSAGSVEDKLAAWVEASAPLLERWDTMLEELRTRESIDSAIISVGIRHMQKLCAEDDVYCA